MRCKEITETKCYLIFFIAICCWCKINSTCTIIHYSITYILCSKHSQYFLNNLRKCTEFWLTSELRCINRVSNSIICDFHIPLSILSTDLFWNAFHFFHSFTFYMILLICLNPLRAKFLTENINIYLHFMSFLHTNNTQVVEIPPRVRQGPAYST